MADLLPGADAPVETVAPAADAAPAPDSTADQVADAPEGEVKPDAPPEKLLPQSEVDRLIAKTRAQENRKLQRLSRDQIRAEVERDFLLKQQQERQPQPTDGAPKPEDFNGNYEKWLIAQAKYEFQQDLKQRDQQSTAQRDARESQQVLAERGRLLDERLDSVVDEYPDIRELIQSETLPFTDPMAASVLELHEYGGKVMGYLATHPDEAAKIAKLHPVRQVLAYDALGKKLTAAPRPNPTPAPIVPSSGRAPVEKRLEDASSQEEFNAIRRKQIAARKGAWK